jgi:serine/threonine-protein kinase
MGGPGSPAADGAPPTDNLDAYQIYLRGKAQVRSPDESRKAMLEGIDLLEQATRLDPKFAQGWAELSYAHSLTYNNRWDFTEARLAKARECADRALALQPSLREGHLALGFYYYWGRRDYAQAADEFRAAAGGREDDPEAFAALAYMKRRQGRWDEALAALEKAYSLNPRDFQLVTNLGGTYKAMARYNEALRFVDLAADLAPGVPGIKLGKVFILLERDANTRAAREALRSMDRADIPDYPAILSFLDFLDGRYPEALAHLDRYDSDVIEGQSFYSPKILHQGLIYLAMNDRARAHAACESARQRLERDVAANPRDPRMRSALGHALACLGRRDEAVREARLAVDLVPVTTDALDGPDYLIGLAHVYAALGDDDAAVDILEKAAPLPGSTIPFNLMDPAFARVRDLPRVRKLLETAR